MTAYTNTAEGGTDGTAVTTANSGGSSGNAWDAVTLTGAGSTVTFDALHGAHGSLGYKFAGIGAGVSSSAYVEKSFPTDSMTIAARANFYLVTNPTASATLMNMVGSIGAAQRLRIFLSSTGFLSVLDSSNTTVGTFTTPIPLNGWFRVEAVAAISTTTGSITVSRYDTADATVPIETLTLTGQNFGAGVATIRFGHTTTTTAQTTIFADDIAMNDVGAAIGPLNPVPDLQVISAPVSINASSAATSLTVTAPRGTGGIIVVETCANGGGGIPFTAPDGTWTAIDSWGRLWWKPDDGAASWVFTCASNNRPSGGALRIIGADVDNPIAAVSATVTSNTTCATPPTVSPLDFPYLLLLFWGKSDQHNLISPPAGLTVLFQRFPATTASLEMCAAAYASPYPSGVPSSSYTATGDSTTGGAGVFNFGAQVAIRPQRRFAAHYKQAVRRAANY